MPTKRIVRGSTDSVCAEKGVRGNSVNIDGGARWHRCVRVSTEAASFGLLQDLRSQLLELK